MNSLLRLASRWRRLPAAERRFTAHVWLLLPLCEVLLRWTRLETLLSLHPVVAGANCLPPSRAASLVEAVAAIHPCRPRCLARALVGCWALRDGGTEAQVVIGCPPATPFEPHAWLRAGGLTLMGGRVAGACREIHVFAGTAVER